MSRIAATVSSGNTNRRFIFLAIGLGLLGAILVYVAFSRDSSSGGGASVSEIPVVVAIADIPARTRITPAMVDVRFVDEESRSALGFSEIEQVVGQVTRFPITANEQVLSTKIVSLAPSAAAASRSLSFVVPQGKRAFAIGADAVQEAGGLILPGDYVDIFVMYDVEFATQSAGSYVVQVALQNIEVLAVAQTIVDIVPEATPTAGGQRVRNSEARPDPAAGTITLLLTPEQAQRVYLAEANGRIRLALRAYGDSEEKPIDHMTKNELLPQNLPNPFLR
jgi:pilus assembly protein CpaB